MRHRQQLFGTIFCAVGLCLAFTTDSCRGQASGETTFRDILALSRLTSSKLTGLDAVATFSDKQRAVFFQVVDRLKQFRRLPSRFPEAASMPDHWLSSRDEVVGEIFHLRGYITLVETVVLDEKQSLIHGVNQIYESRFIFASDSDTEQIPILLLSTKVPKRWQPADSNPEPVVVRGVLASVTDERSDRLALLIADHIGWFPAGGTPTGQLLLARHGMDVGLLDEVQHNQPFVPASVSREGEAFYDALKALRQIEQKEILKLAKENVTRVAEQWKQQREQLAADLAAKRTQLKQSTDENERKRLAQIARLAQSRRDMAITVARQAKNKQSSVAPMLLQPSKEVGELFYFDGTARRAIWIDSEGQADVPGYYEIEVYTAEARLLDDRPMVCCMTRLPEGFPVGDEIREPVRIAGIFFKSWRYRARDDLRNQGGRNQGGRDQGGRDQSGPDQGQTSQPRWLYTPVLLGKQPIWLTTSSKQTEGWAVWAGVSFLLVLAVLWGSMIWLSGSDRRAHRSLRRDEKIEL